MITKTTGLFRLGLSAIALLALPACATEVAAQSPSITSDLPEATAAACPPLVNGALEDRKVTEVYQIGRDDEKVFDIRLDCTNRCSSEYVRMQASSLPVANRMFFLALTAVETGQLVDVSVVSSGGNAMCIPQGAGTLRETGDWIRLKSTPSALP